MEEIQWISSKEGRSIDFDAVDNCDNELEEINKNKNGRNFVYPDSFIKLLGYMRAYFHLSYKQTEGVVREHAENKIPSIPDHSTIDRRIIKLDIHVNNNKLGGNDVIIAIDSTEIKITNSRG